MEFVVGEAKIRRTNVTPTVYHHTSTLRTNLIWMSGVIDVEGTVKKVLHPHLGELRTDPALRRSMTDFPAVAWFTRQIKIPNVLVKHALYLEDKVTGELRRMEADSAIANSMSLNRIALGFPLADIALTPWPDYRGYSTPEGRKLNETAREAGDNPSDWYVSETPIDVMKVSEFWSSRSVFEPKLERSDQYIADIKRMVTMCREKNGVYIPPTWFKPEQAVELGRRLGVNVIEPR